THIVHVSSAEALPKVAAAKAKGLPLTAETCAHYLYFNAECIPDGNSLFKCAPPIREADNNDQLIEAFAKRVLDFITTDHSPAPPELKEIETGNLQKAWGGIAGLQWLLPAAFTAMKQSLSLDDFIPLLTEKPAAFLQLQHRKGYLKVGYDADIVIWHPEKEFVVTAANTFHKHKASPYIGERLCGAVQGTFVNGVPVFMNGRIQGTRAYGEIVLGHSKEK
ncbi:MAG: allantoinase, partial [Chitinophagaceae bacterium]